MILTSLKISSLWGEQKQVYLFIFKESVCTSKCSCKKLEQVKILKFFGIQAGM